jgi:hypothetical protein
MGPDLIGDVGDGERSGPGLGAALIITFFSCRRHYTLV